MPYAKPQDKGQIVRARNQKRGCVPGVKSPAWGVARFSNNPRCKTSKPC